MPIAIEWYRGLFAYRMAHTAIALCRFTDVMFYRNGVKQHISSTSKAVKATRQLQLLLKQTSLFVLFILLLTIFNFQF